MQIINILGFLIVFFVLSYLISNFITRYFGIQVKLFDKLFEYRMKEFSNTNTVPIVIFAAHNFLGNTIAIKYRPFLSN